MFTSLLFSTILFPSLVKSIIIGLSNNLYPSAVSNSVIWYLPYSSCIIAFPSLFVAISIAFVVSSSIFSILNLTPDKGSFVLLSILLIVNLFEVKAYVTSICLFSVTLVNAGIVYVPSAFALNGYSFPFTVIPIISYPLSGVITISFVDESPYFTVSYGFSSSPVILPPFTPFSSFTSVVIWYSFLLFSTVSSWTSGMFVSG